MYVVHLCKTFDQALLVLPYSPREVICYPDIEGSFRLAGENVNVILAVHGVVIVVDSRFRGNDRASERPSLVNDATTYARTVDILRSLDSLH